MKLQVNLFPLIVSKSLTIVSNKIHLIRHFIPKKFPFYFLGDFNLLHIDWNIPNTTYNDCHKSFIKFCSVNILTQLTESPTHKDGNILVLLLCNYMGIDIVKFHSVDSPLTDTNDHNLISFGNNVDKSTKPASETFYPVF